MTELTLSEALTELADALARIRVLEDEAARDQAYLQDMREYYCDTIYKLEGEIAALHEELDASRYQARMS